jgi:hypothetical protein
MELSELKNIIEQIFSKSGYEVNSFTFFCPTSSSISMKKTESSLDISFKEGMPSVKTKKFFITISAHLEGLSLGEDGGTIKLKYFPDINFSYGRNSSEERFGAFKNNIDIKKIKSQINQEFPDSARNKIANLALQYAQEWTNIASDNGNDLSFYKNKRLRKKHRQDCESFVKENIMLSKDVEAKSAILTFILIYFVLPAVVSWVVKKFLDNFFK